MAGVGYNCWKQNPSSNTQLTRCQLKSHNAESHVILCNVCFSVIEILSARIILVSNIPKSITVLIKEKHKNRATDFIKRMSGHSM
jgi:hypothetical protein